MMLFARVCFVVIALLSAAMVSGSDEMNDDSMVLNEEFTTLEDIIAGDHHNLRSRQLQTSTTTQPVCRATRPSNKYACGDGGGGADDPCKNSNASCDTMTEPKYDCSCTASSETSCSYCQIRTANAILCQVSGSSTTFVAPDKKMTTCSCQYIGNGQVHQVCVNPTPQPTFGPSTNVPATSPVVLPPTGTAQSAVVPTPVPTRAPTRMPTRAPTRMPTRAPTRMPTRAPTHMPTRAPTRMPTRAPTSAPTTAMPVPAPTRTKLRDTVSIP